MHLLEIRIQAIQPSPYHAGPSAHHSIRLDMVAGFLACSCPLLAFRPQVSHQTQKPPSEFLPTVLGIQQGASWRTRSRRRTTGRRGHAGRGHCCIEAQGVLGSYRRGMQARQAPQRTVTNRASERLLHGFWSSRGTRSGGPIAMKQCLTRASHSLGV